MKKFILISVLLAGMGGYSFFSCKQKSPASEKLIEKTLLLQIDSFTSLCTKLQLAAESNSSTGQQLQNLFLQSRIAYKKFEWAAEYFLPANSRIINGPPVQEIEMPDIQVLEPAGLQIIESLLFPGYDTAHKKDLISQLKMLPLSCEKYK